MTNEQAKNAFSTFSVALAMSLLIFGTAYIVITEISDSDNSVLQANNTQEIENEVKPKPVYMNNESDSVFAKLVNPAETTPLTSSVLAEATQAPPTSEDLGLYDETAEGTTPGGGSEMILGIVLAITFVIFGYYYYIRGSKFAFDSFEKRVLEDIERY